MSKGLSSSAAICVLVARAFNRVYNLRLSIRGEMEFAYLGEITTPSKCGRMDQACAYGSVPVLMTFDGDILTVDRVQLAVSLHLVLVDLKAAKDTTTILKSLQQAYPTPRRTCMRDYIDCWGLSTTASRQRPCRRWQPVTYLDLGMLGTHACCMFGAQEAPPTQVGKLGGNLNLKLAGRLVPGTVR
ncbi:hypothetical protein Vafri_3252 [Volvox africanus]|uniref:GHMP kinase N-terminal domain-containing protein n=1 Tax=Volvox africanus TaxID=51714 RepID=A0A8J4EUJ5_9CHLO|nr:hypothetical protein Vafri_3252 [Volvox africanus]